jgi:flagella basal body P-ring formation protein FlgA
MFNLLYIIILFLSPIISNATNLNFAIEENLLLHIKDHHFDKLEIICPLEEQDNIAKYNTEISDLDIKKKKFKLSIYNETENKILLCKYKELTLIPVFKIKITPGYLIEESDLTEKYFDNSQISHEIATSINDVVNKTPKKTLQPYTPIKKLSLHTPFIINKNDHINGIYHKNNIKMNISIIALDSGAKGDIIRVKNTRSNAIISGEIINNNTVKIE